MVVIVVTHSTTGETVVIGIEPLRGCYNGYNLSLRIAYSKKCVSRVAKANYPLYESLYFINK